jgi:aldehyde dehydrogenase (NAD+)
MPAAEHAAALNPVADHDHDGSRGIAADLRATFDTGRTRPLAWRRAQLAALAAMLTAHEDDIVDAVRADMGKPVLEAWMTEVAASRSDAESAIRNLEAWTAPRRVATPLVTRPGRSAVHLDPLGVVLVIAPWNYPVALALQPLVAAIAAGNCAVVKPSEITPTCAALLADLVPRHLDPDCVRVVQGGVEETTALLAQRWDHIFFTGNGTVGRVVMRAAAEHLTPVTLELGGKSPCIVDASADLEVAAARIAWGKFFNAGQTCVAPDHVLVDRRVEQRLLDLLAERVTAFYGADPSTSPDYGRIVDDRHLRRVAALLDGGRPVVGGVVDAATRYVAPTVLTDVDLDARVMQEEIFGPILPVIGVDGIESAIRFVASRPKPLALYLFTTDDAVAEEVLARTSSGGVTINHTWVHLANANLPFGGVGESGTGAYHGRAGVDALSHHKSVLRKPAGLDVPLLYPPHRAWKQAVIRRAT